MSAEIDKLDEIEFWNQRVALEDQQYKEMSWEALRRLNKRMKKLELEKESGSQSRKRGGRGRN